MENIKKNSFGNRTGSLAESWFISDGKSRSMAARDLVLYKLVNACIDQGPEAGPKVRPQAFKLGGKRSSLTGPWIWDIVGLRKMKRALMRSSMRAAQGPWLRDEIIAPGMLGTGGHGPGSQTFEPTHTISQATSDGLKLYA